MTTCRTITRRVLNDEEWRAAAVGRGMPAAAADFTLGMYRAARWREFAATDPTLKTLIGRLPVPVRSTLQAIASGH